MAFARCTKCSSARHFRDVGDINVYPGRFTCEVCGSTDFERMYPSNTKKSDQGDFCYRSTKNRSGPEFQLVKGYFVVAGIEPYPEVI